MINFVLNNDLTEEQVKNKDIIYSELIDHTPDIQRRSSGPSYIPTNSSLEDFVDLIKELIDLNQEAKSKKVKLIDEHSYINVLEDPDNPGEDLAGAVLYSLVERTPGTTAGGNTPHSRQRREITPQFRGTSYDETEDTQGFTIHKGQWFDNYICLKIVARTNVEANSLALWLEELMETHRSFFANIGIVRYFFDRRGKDEYHKDDEVGYHCRPLYFHVRTERIYNITEQIINKLVVMLSN